LTRTCGISPLALLHLAVVAARLCGPGGVRAVIEENLLLKQQVIVMRRARRWAPNLTWSVRLCGFTSLFLTSGRVQKLAIALRPSTLLAFHHALVRRKYRLLFSARQHPKKPGPKGRTKRSSEPSSNSNRAILASAVHGLHPSSRRRSRSI